MCDVYAEALQNYLHSSEWRVSAHVLLLLQKLKIFTLCFFGSL